MKLHEIISNMENDHETALLYDVIAPYKKLLYFYFKDQFGCEPILMVTSVTNCTQYVKIVPANEFSDALYHWIESMELNKEDADIEGETISFNSRMFKDVL